MADEDEAHRAVEKMLKHLHGSRTDGDVAVLFHLARRLPMASLVAVQESLRRRGVVGFGYAVNALKNQRKDRDG